MKPLSFHIRDVLDAASLAQAMKQLLRERSWNEVKKLIAHRHVQVNGNLCTDEGRRLKTGDVLKVFEEPLPKPASAADLFVHHCDSHLLIVDKPAGVNSLRHAEERSWPARRKALQPSLDELLNEWLAKHAQPRRSAKVRPVHRLDRDTSGLMAFALSAQAEQELEKMFARHSIRRIYIAVAHGAVKSQDIETQLVRDRGDGLRGSKANPTEDEQPQRALTHVRLIRSFNHPRGETFSLIECELETGRTHQIRIHLSEIGHRLVGEKMYNKPLGQKPLADSSGAPRQFLHSHQMHLLHPITREPMEFTSVLPRDLQAWMKSF
jgi:23S rRNA pseudouridine1911/1915/1917 synthase